MSDLNSRIEAEIPHLRRYARTLARRRNTADDLVQDCLARALSNIHQWEHGTNLRAWLFSIMHNAYVSEVRRAACEGAAVRIIEDEPLLPRAAEQGKRLELRDLHRALGRIPEEQRIAILLVGLEGMSYKAIAEIVGEPLGTIRSRISRGRAALRRMVDGTDERAEPTKAA